jgi:hypothetical protein
MQYNETDINADMYVILCTEKQPYTKDGFVGASQPCVVFNR